MLLYLLTQLMFITYVVGIVMSVLLVRILRQCLNSRCCALESAFQTTTRRLMDTASSQSNCRQLERVRTEMWPSLFPLQV